MTLKETWRRRNLASALTREFQLLFTNQNLRLYQTGLSQTTEAVLYQTFHTQMATQPTCWRRARSERIIATLTTGRSLWRGRRPSPTLKLMALILTCPVATISTILRMISAYNPSSNEGLSLAPTVMRSTVIRPVLSASNDLLIQMSVRGQVKVSVGISLATIWTYVDNLQIVRSSLGMGMTVPSRLTAIPSIWMLQNPPPMKLQRATNPHWYHQNMRPCLCCITNLPEAISAWPMIQTSMIRFYLMWMRFCQTATQSVRAENTWYERLIVQSRSSTIHPTMEAHITVKLCGSIHALSDTRSEMTEGNMWRSSGSPHGSLLLNLVVERRHSRLFRGGSLARYELRGTAASTNQNEGSPVGRGRVSDHRDCYSTMMAGDGWSHYLQNMLCCNVAIRHALLSVPVSPSQITSGWSVQKNSSAGVDHAYTITLNPQPHYPHSNLQYLLCAWRDHGKPYVQPLTLSQCPAQHGLHCHRWRSVFSIK